MNAATPLFFFIVMPTPLLTATACYAQLGSASAPRVAPLIAATQGVYATRVTFYAFHIMPRLLCDADIELIC